MQDELRQLQEAEGEQHADRKKTGTSKNSKAAPPAAAGHYLKRTWSTGNEPSGEREPKHALVSNNSSTVDRWLKESMREQPWNNIGAILEPPPTKEAPGMRGETGSNSAVAGSEERK
ncbi:hypothetical protein HO173_002913 [Letharia columbiana]|nr:uncharacterized protein HO173_002913 [Letharia columbiana]KAF6239041.1 hypothetical protein HO173_002913 [Letharia columbiana]